MHAHIRNRRPCGVEDGTVKQEGRGNFLPIAFSASIESVLAQLRQCIAILSGNIYSIRLAFRPS